MSKPPHHSLTPESPEFAAFLGKFDEELRYRLRERAAILEFDGGAAQDAAEKWVMDNWETEKPLTRVPGSD